MKQYNELQLDKMIQPLIKFMDAEYPNNYELVIDDFSAQIRNKQAEMTFLKTEEPLPEGDNTEQANAEMGQAISSDPFYTLMMGLIIGMLGSMNGR